VKELLAQGGPVLLLIFALSGLGWWIAVWKWLELRAEFRSGLEPAREVLRRPCADSRPVPLPAEAGAGSSLLVICTAREIASGQEPGRRRFLDSLLRSEAVALRRYLDLIAAIAVATPLLGLLGTVLGMMRTFQTLTQGGAAPFSQLSDGIAEALVTTQAGLVVAVPLYLVHRVLFARWQALVEATGRLVRRAERQARGAGASRHV
jgi:biopolymer transport protein ExbB